MSQPTPGLRYSRAWLPRVSRSFAPSIAQLGMPLELPVGLAYLLCRVVDTVEDSQELGPSQRDRLFEGFRAGLLSASAAEAFCEDAAHSFGDRRDDESLLMQDAATLFRHYRALQPDERSCMTPWIIEMASGMQEFAERSREPGTLVVLADEADLQRYCHYVAGTVGGLLTDLFLLHDGSIDKDVQVALRQRAESFAQGLQQVNIAKDLAADHQRGWQFLPRSFCTDLEPQDLLNPAHRAAAMRAHAKLCDLAERELERALEYTLLLPNRSAARRFCALPLLMARATFRELRGNEAVFDPDRTVKIEHSEAMELIRFTAEQAKDDGALHALYRHLGSRAFGANTQEGSGSDGPLNATPGR